jgi:hypothetical protein
MREKFHLEAELVLPSTVRRLERRLTVGESLFDVYPFTVVSTDYIKSDRRRDDFLRAAPELVIVDEAHTCVEATTQGRGGRHQRYALLKGLAIRSGTQPPARHRDPALRQRARVPGAAGPPRSGVRAAA